MDAILKNDPLLEELEHRRQWKTTIDYCYQQWANNRCVERLLRLMLQVWYLCSYIDQLPPFDLNPASADIDYVKLTRILQEALINGDLHYNKDASFLCLSGYMMAVHPEWFANHDNSYAAIKRCGLDKMEQACNLNSTYCLFLQEKSRGTSKEEAALLFPGNSEVDCYFKEIITNTGDS